MGRYHDLDGDDAEFLRASAEWDQICDPDCVNGVNIGDMPEATELPICCVCLGELTYLGALGKVQWFRCRDCGLPQQV